MRARLRGCTGCDPWEPSWWAISRSATTCRCACGSASRGPPPVGHGSTAPSAPTSDVARKLPSGGARYNEGSMAPTVLVLLTALAQSPADRASLEALRDSLATVSDTVALSRLEATTIPIARQHRDDPMIHLRLGFIAYHLGEITRTKSHYD